MNLYNFKVAPLKYRVIQIFKIHYLHFFLLFLLILLITGCRLAHTTTIKATDNTHSEIDHDTNKEIAIRINDWIENKLIPHVQNKGKKYLTIKCHSADGNCSEDENNSLTYEIMMKIKKKLKYSETAYTSNNSLELLNHTNLIISTRLDLLSKRIYITIKETDIESGKLIYKPFDNFECPASPEIQKLYKDCQAQSQPSNAPLKNPEKPSLFYYKNKDKIILRWNTIDPSLKYILFKKRLDKSTWIKVNESPSIKSMVFYSKRFKWNTIYKVRSINKAGLWTDSDTIKITRDCEANYDFSYKVVCNSSYCNPCMKKFIKYFENVLQKRLTDMGKTYCSLPTALHCSDHILYFSIASENILFKSPFIIKDFIADVDFITGKYVYIKNDRCKFGIAKIDKQIVKEEVDTLISKLFPTSSHSKPFDFNKLSDYNKSSDNMPSSPNTSAKTLLCPNGKNKIWSLMEAKQICEKKGGGLLSEKDWFKHRNSFKDKNKNGEYVIGGYIFYDTITNKWQFEKLHQPDAVNIFCVRCLQDN